MAVDMATATRSAMVVRFDQAEPHPQDLYTVVVVSDGQHWSALCRELDIASDGDSAEEAAQNVVLAIHEALAVAAQHHVPAGEPVPDSELINFMNSHVGPEPVSTYVFSVQH